MKDGTADNTLIIQYFIYCFSQDFVGICSPEKDDGVAFALSCLERQLVVAFSAAADYTCS